MKFLRSTLPLLSLLGSSADTPSVESIPRSFAREDISIGTVSHSPVVDKISHPLQWSTASPEISLVYAGYTLIRK